MTNNELNIAIAEACGWRWFHFAPSESNQWCYFAKPAEWITRKGGREIQRPETLDPARDDWTSCPNYCSDLNAAFSLLESQNFLVFTCDAGYACKIYTAPELGEEELAEGFGGTVAYAICQAFLRTLGKWKENAATSESTDGQPLSEGRSPRTGQPTG